MFDISDSNAINASFRAILDMDYDTPGRREMAETFGRMFFAQLTDENKAFWKWCFKSTKVIANSTAMGDCEGRILARQERMMMDW